MPDDRLRAAADFVRQGAVFADIGTDHAYLPVFLCREGRVSVAYAADVAEGPLQSAKAHIAASGLSGRITTLLTDGLTGMESLGLTDIAICGMGGELMADILCATPFVKQKGMRLILQPMSRPAAVRHYLAQNGFSSVTEKVVQAKGRLYFCMCADYTGEDRTLSRLSAELGTEDVKVVATDEKLYALLKQQQRVQEKRCRGLGQAELPRCELEQEKEYLAALSALVRRVEAYLQEEE